MAFDKNRIHVRTWVDRHAPGPLTAYAWIVLGGVRVAKGEATLPRGLAEPRALEDAKNRAIHAAWQAFRRQVERVDD